MESKSLGLMIAVAGLLAVLMGLVVYFGGFAWFGRLPGDVRFERQNMRLFFPLTSMLLLSVVLSLLLGLLRRFL